MQQKIITIDEVESVLCKAFGIKDLLWVDITEGHKGTKLIDQPDAIMGEIIGAAES